MVICRNCSPSKEPEWHVSKIACNNGIKLELQVKDSDKERTTRVLPIGKRSTRHFLNSWMKSSQQRMKSKFEKKTYIVNQISVVHGYEGYSLIEINGIKCAHGTYVTPSSHPSSSDPVSFIICFEWPETVSRMMRFGYEPIEHHSQWKMKWSPDLASSTSLLISLN